MAKADPEFLARQLERVLHDLGALKEDGSSVVARLDRIDATIEALRYPQRAARPKLKELLLAEAPRAEIAVPPRGGMHRRPTPDPD